MYEEYEFSQTPCLLFNPKGTEFPEAKATDMADKIKQRRHQT